MNVRKSGSRSGMYSGRPGRYQLDVIACDVVDVVRSAGGWLFDRSAAGWSVNVALIENDHCDRLPLKILGLNTWPQEKNTNRLAPAVTLALALSAAAVAADDALGANVLRAVKHGTGDVLLWGDPGPEGIQRGLDLVEHELSAAARVFKGYALAAVGLSEPIGPTEVFRGRASVLTCYSDLMPAAAPSWARR